MRRSGFRIRSPRTTILIVILCCLWKTPDAEAKNYIDYVDPAANPEKHVVVDNRTPFVRVTNGHGIIISNTRLADVLYDFIPNVPMQFYSYEWYRNAFWSNAWKRHRDIQIRPLDSLITVDIFFSEPFNTDFRRGYNRHINIKISLPVEADFQALHP